MIELDPLKCTGIPSLLHVLFNFSPKPCMYGMTMEMLLLCLLLLLSLLLLFWLSFCQVVVTVVDVFEFKLFL